MPKNLTCFTVYSNVHTTGNMKFNYEMALVNEKVVLAPYRKYRRNRNVLVFCCGFSADVFLANIGVAVEMIPLT
jgi:hypothetical protein